MRLIAIGESKLHRIGQKLLVIRLFLLPPMKAARLNVLIHPCSLIHFKSLPIFYIRVNIFQFLGIPSRNFVFIDGITLKAMFC